MPDIYIVQYKDTDKSSNNDWQPFAETAAYCVGEAFQRLSELSGSPGFNLSVTNIYRVVRYEPSALFRE